MADLRTPIICTVIGEGGSGGALAIGIGDRINMLQYSTYSVISPEGCASILWKSADKAADAAQAMGITSEAASLEAVLVEQLSQLSPMLFDDLIRQRSEKLRSFGEFKDS